MDIQTSTMFNRNFIRWTLLSLVLGLVIFYPSIEFDYLINYDDGPLIVNNPAVQNFTISKLFSEFVFGLYHPITSLSFAIDNLLFKGISTGFHWVNLLLHFINAVLCYLLVFKLIKKELIAGVCMVLFVIHPMHVESVVWLSERKDLLYTMFFLGACIAYLKSIEGENKVKWNGITFGLFVLAVLSKSAAVVFPLVLLLIDLHKNQFSVSKSTVRIVPFVLVSLIVGYVNVLAQDSAGFIQDILQYSFVERVLLFCYSTVYYEVSFVLPLDLSPKHFYPLIENSQLPVKYYLSAVLLLLSLFAAWRLISKNKRYLFPIAFFAITVILVLKIVPTGNDVVSDRYSYLPYVGLAMLLGYLAEYIYEKYGKSILQIVGVVFLLGFTSISYSYVGVWENEIAIWDHVIEKNPDYTTGYAERGRNYLDNGKISKAIKDLNRAIELDSLNSIAYNHRGLALVRQEKPEQAYEDYSRAIGIDSKYSAAYSNRGVLLSKYGRTEEGIQDLTKAVTLNPKDADNYNNLGIAYAQLQQWKLAKLNFEKCVNLNPKHKDALSNLARLNNMQ